MPVRRGRQRAAGAADRGRRGHLARLPARDPAGPAVRLPGARTVRPGAGQPLQPREAAARPVRESRRRPGRLGRVGVRVQLGRPRRAERRRLRTARPEGSGRQPVLRLGGRAGAAHAVPRVGDLRGARQGADRDPSRRAGGDARHVLGPGAPGDDGALRAARDHRGRADAGAPLRARPPPGRARAAQLLGLQHHRVLRAARAVHRDRDRRAAGDRVQGDGARAAPRRARGDPRRRLQPHRGGQPPRTDAVVPGHRQRGVLPARRRRPRALLRHDRHRATAC